MGDQKDSYSGGSAPVSDVLGGEGPAADTAPSANNNASTSVSSANNCMSTTEPQQRDFSQLPKLLDDRFGAHDPDGAVRPCILRTSSAWTRRRLDTPLGESETAQSLYEEEQSTE